MFQVDPAHPEEARREAAEERDLGRVGPGFGRGDARGVRIEVARDDQRDDDAGLNGDGGSLK